MAGGCLVIQMSGLLFEASEFDEFVAHHIRVGSEATLHFVYGVCHDIVPVLPVQVNDIQVEAVSACGSRT